MDVRAPILSATRDYPDARREQESIHGRGNGFAGSGLSIVRSMKVVSDVTGKKPANQRNVKTATRLQNGLFIKREGRQTANRPISIFKRNCEKKHTPSSDLISWILIE